MNSITFEFPRASSDELSLIIIRRLGGLSSRKRKAKSSIVSRLITFRVNVVKFGQSLNGFFWWSHLNETHMVFSFGTIHDIRHCVTMIDYILTHVIGSTKRNANSYEKIEGKTVWMTYVKFSGTLATCSICEGDDKLLVSLTAMVWFLNRCTYRELVKSIKLVIGKSSSLSPVGWRSSWILEKLTQMVFPFTLTWSKNCLQSAAWWGFDICTWLLTTRGRFFLCRTPKQWHYLQLSITDP